MGLFDEVKENVTVRQAAERYGFKITKSGLIRCIFHNDKTPSMKVDSRYYCFGCGVTGDVIDFTAQLFGLSLKEAALKLAEDFGIHISGEGRKIRQKEQKFFKRRTEDHSVKTEEKELTTCVRVMLDYLGTLREWKKEFAPKSPEEEWNEKFMEKSNLTLEEAAAYSGIGINKLRKMTDDQNCQFVLWNGTKRLIKRKKLDEYTEMEYSI